MSDCKNCDCQGGESGFIFGLVIGAVIGAAVAVYIYKNNKTDVFADLKNKLERYFQGFTTKSKSETETPKNTTHKSKVIAAKIPVVLPKKIVKETAIAKTVTSKPRKFVKPKKLS